MFGKESDTDDCSARELSSLPAMKIYKFRDCLLHPVERSVIKGSERIELTTKTFDVLQFLIENAGSIVTKDQLLGEVWKGDFVEESNLPVHISKLRRSLNENVDHRFIETVQGTGYRFVAPVHVIQEGEWTTTASLASRTRQAIHDELAYSTTIAVLPLKNEGGRPDTDYLIDGLTEELINRLSHIPNLKVISRNAVFAFKDRNPAIAEVSRTFNASMVLTGRARSIDDRVVVGLELTDAQRLIHCWGEQYDQPITEIPHLPKAIVDSLCGILNIATNDPSSNIASSTDNGDSYRFYLMGKYFLNRRTSGKVNKAIKCFQKSLSFNPTNTRSCVAVIEGYHLLYVLGRISRAEMLTSTRSIIGALSQRNETLDVWELAQAKLQLHLAWNSYAAENHIQRALKLNPNLVDGHYFRGDLLGMLGYQDEAFHHIQKILALDPLSVLSFKQVGRILYKLGRFEDAISYLTTASEMESCDYETLLLLSAALTELGEFSSALPLLTKSYQIHANIETLSMIGYVEALRGNPDRAYEIVERIDRELAEHQGHHVNLARIFLALNDKTKVYSLLDRAIDERAIDMYALEFDPRWKAIRNEPEFSRLVGRVHDFCEVTRHLSLQHL